MQGLYGGFYRVYRRIMKKKMETTVEEYRAFKTVSGCAVGF